MGLYGAVKKDAATGQAYAGHSYDSEVVLLYSEIDPELHQAIDNGTYGTPPMTSTIGYNAGYCLINGRSYPAHAHCLPAMIEGERVLLRFLNAGLRTRVPVLLGLYMSVVAEDGNPYTFPSEQYSLLLPAGKTRDAVISPSAVRGYSLYDRTLKAPITGQKECPNVSVQEEVPAAPPPPACGLGLGGMMIVSIFGLLLMMLVQRRGYS